MYLRRISEELLLGNGRKKLLTSASVKAVGALLDIGDVGSLLGLQKTMGLECSIERLNTMCST